MNTLHTDIPGLNLKTFQGKEIIMYYINELKTEGVTTAPRWVQPDNVESESGL